jgi:hypothetical protein
LQRWLAEALREEGGRERPHEPVFEAAGVSQGTFYKVLGGKGSGVRQSQITALAHALGAPVPMVDRVLRFPGDPLYRVESIEPPKAAPAEVESPSGEDETKRRVRKAFPKGQRVQDQQPPRKKRRSSGD